MSMSEIEEHRCLRLWGKTKKGSTNAGEFHPAIFHMLDVACVAYVLLGEKASPRWRNALAGVLNCEPDRLIDWIPWIISLHDIGKISVPFQEQQPLQRARLISEGFNLGEKQQWGNMPVHATISQIFVRNELQYPLPKKLQDLLFDMCGGHHGYFGGKNAYDDARQLLRKEPADWKSMRLEAGQILFDLLMHSDVRWPDMFNISAASMSLTGFSILCDWLGSDERKFVITPNLSLEEYYLLSKERAYRAVSDAGFLRASKSKTPTPFGMIFPKLEPRPLQKAIDDIPDTVFKKPCLVIIEAPTGEGKTEASLALAHRIAQYSDTDELYYALPTTATSNQIFKRLQGYLQENLGLSAQVKLIHGQAFLVEDDLRIEVIENACDDESEALSWFAPLKRAMLSPFGVGTIDQAELAALNVKHVPLRMIGLAGKVLILDEIHAYDVYMTTIIEQLLNWLSAVGTSVILLSATLPKERRANLAKAYGIEMGSEKLQNDAYPSLWIANKEHRYCSTPLAQQEKRTVHLNMDLSFSDEQANEKASWLVEQVRDGGCACWITNTVGRAQDIFTEVEKLAPDYVERFIFHAQFPLDERHLLEEEITERFGPKTTERPPSIVIGTQVLEQSLDLDFDVMVSDIAPIDLLLQRAGRLHRHLWRIRSMYHCHPHLYVNVKRTPEGAVDFEVNQCVYDEYILLLTWQVLSGKQEIVLPADYRPLVDSVYNAIEPDSASLLYSTWDKMKKKADNGRDQARLRILPNPHPNDSFAEPASRLKFVESETEARWIIAKTRLGEETINIIPLERMGNKAQFSVDRETYTIGLDEKLPRDMQIKLLRHSMRISNQYGVQAIKDNQKKVPLAFSKSDLLKDYFPLFLTDGKISLPLKNRIVDFDLDPKLGMIIRTKKGTEAHD